MSQATARNTRAGTRLLSIGAIILCAVLAVASLPWLLPSIKERLAVGSSSVDKGETEHAEHAEGGHEGHDHAGHSDADSLELTPQARENLGLKIGKVEVRDFQRTITIPGIVVERPGRSTIEITAPLTGVITKIVPIEGEAVESGQLLFEIRLTHEELVQAQGELLRTAEELDVVGLEVKRLEEVTKNGAVAGKTFLERKYEQQKMEAVLRAQSQALQLHGLSAEQVDDILKKRNLLRSLNVAVPPSDEQASASDRSTAYQVQELLVEKGKHVNSGDTLAILTDHSKLLIQGSAFEQDVADINRAVEESLPVSAVMTSKSGTPEVIEGLEILYLAGAVDSETRAFHFYVSLPNTVLRDNKQPDGHRFINWQYKPGQRMQLRVPIERLPKRIVLPVEAVAQDGVETYVFQPNGDHFDRRPVRVEYRDQFEVVIANDGSLFPGDPVALSGAQQMQLALKNKAGGAIDPHAGHNH